VTEKNKRREEVARENVTRGGKGGTPGLPGPVKGWSDAKGGGGRGGTREKGRTRGGEMY